MSSQLSDFTEAVLYKAEKQDKNPPAVVPGKRYMHFKGIPVKVLSLAMHTETEEILVVYEHEETGEVWARPYSMFTSMVDKSKYPNAKQEWRFEMITSGNKED